MNLIRRLKNLWELSEYRIGLKDNKILVKDFPTIENKLATIIIESKNIFEEEQND